MPLTRVLLVDATSDVHACFALAFPDLDKAGAISTATRSDAVARAESDRPDVILLPAAPASAVSDLRVALGARKAIAHIPVISLPTDGTGMASPATLAEQVRKLFAEVRLVSQLAHLEELGDKAFVQEMVGLFLDTTPARLEAGRRALSAGNLDAVEQAVHGLKSSAANLGADEIQELAGKMERLAHAGQGSALQPLMRQLEDAFERVATRLAGERGA
jgi:HPt (histidine-containing phosphotransfer) domain-containing protein